MISIWKHKHTVLLSLILDSRGVLFDRRAQNIAVLHSVQMKYVSKKVESLTYILSTLWQLTLHIHLQTVAEKSIEVPQQGLKTIDPLPGLEYPDNPYPVP